MRELVTVTKYTGEILHREILDGDPDFWAAKVWRMHNDVANAHNLPRECVTVTRMYTAAQSLSDLDIEIREYAR